MTAGAPTTYDAMLALQNWFQPEFEYSLDVPQGHGNNAIEAFLRQRIGYCEQFAGTFAAMARSIGVPARVAVGFTPGRASSPTAAASVLGKNAHAWPEVWFDGLGWVPFEPTPGRGAPGAEGYTGLPAGPGRVDPAARPPATGGEAAGAGGHGAAGRGDPRAARRIPRPSPRRRPTSAAGDAQVRRPRHPLGRRRSLVLLVPAALLALPELVRRWRRRHPSADVARQIGDLWERALGAVEATGFRVDPTLTPLEQARAVGPATARWRPGR